eukprot:Gb_30740 [translate_table: standard]
MPGAAALIDGNKIVIFILRYQCEDALKLMEDMRTYLPPRPNFDQLEFGSSLCSLQIDCLGLGLKIRNSPLAKLLVNAFATIWCMDDLTATTGRQYCSGQCVNKFYCGQQVGEDGTTGKYCLAKMPQGRSVLQTRLKGLALSSYQYRHPTSILPIEIRSIHILVKVHACIDTVWWKIGGILRLQVTAGDTPYTSAKTFEDLNLSPELLRGLYSEMGFEKPSKIQAITLPMILTPPYQNLIAQAHNGSGKTTCFVLGMLSRVDPKVAAPQALCVCPTRELAIQNQEVLLKMGTHTGINSVCAVPTDTGNYVSTSRRGPVNEQIVIGTPGTLKKWMSTRVLSTRFINILVFDEADHMLAQHEGKPCKDRTFGSPLHANINS